ncbi:peptidylprolyl isomerase [Pseudaeromonas sharmana]|uniref:Periplasmic chaperone PpiD n=1 Tax=Pseudaeromonas sharmana TaxID=328412 RepID=A0ABV8CQU1_9GAMM
MLMDKLREGAQGRGAKIVFWLIILSFSLAGVGSYLNRPADTSPAKVNDQPITAQEFDQAYQSERGRMQQQFGESFAELADNPEYVRQMRQAVLDRLINQLAVDQQAREAKIRIGDQQIKDTIRAMPEFQKDGQFNNELYLNLLSQARLDPNSFSESIRNQLLQQTWASSLTGTDFVLPSEVTLIDKLLQQTRDAQLYTVPVAHFQKTVSVTDAELETYYKANSNQFRSQEQVNVNFVELDAAALAANIKVEDRELRDYYEQHIDQYRTAERRQVAHILISDKDAAVAEKQAETVLTQLKGGADFAALAKEFSSDKLSARNGGELDWFERGVMDPEFEKAAFALSKPGELSAVVKSQFGLHIIKLVGVQPEHERPFDEVKADVLAKLKADKARDLFIDQQQKLSELAFENPDSLDVVSESMGLKLQQSGLMTTSTAKAPFDDAKLKQQAFAENLRDTNANSEVITVGEGKAYVLHILEHKPAMVRPLADVKADVEAAVKLQKAQVEAEKQAATLLSKLNNGEDVSALVKELDVKVESKTGISRTGATLVGTLLNELFRMPHPAADKPVRKLVAMPEGDQVILVLNKVTDTDQPSAAKSMLQTQLAQGRMIASQAALLQQARDAATIEYNPLFNSQPVSE